MPPHTHRPPPRAITRVLQHVDSVSEKIHKSYFLSFVVELLLKVRCGQFVHLERLIRLYDGRFAFHVPFHIKEVLLVGVGGVLVVRDAWSGRTCPRGTGRTPRSMKIHLPPSITASSSCVISSLPQCQVMNSKKGKKILPSPLKEEGLYVIRTIICLPFSVSIKSSPKGHKKSTAEAMLLKPYY